MCRAPPRPPLPKPRSRDASVDNVQDNHCSLLPPDEMARPRDASQYNPCGLPPPLAKPRSHNSASTGVGDRGCVPVMGDAAKAAGRRLVSASALPVATPYRNGDCWRRHAPKFPSPVKPTPPSPWDHPESRLAVFVLTVIMLFLPLVLPQLPPPPVALLLIPLAVMAASLLVLAFLPSDLRATSSYVNDKEEAMGSACFG